MVQHKGERGDVWTDNEAASIKSRKCGCHQYSRIVDVHLSRHMYKVLLARLEPALLWLPLFAIYLLLIYQIKLHKPVPLGGLQTAILWSLVAVGATSKWLIRNK